MNSDDATPKVKSLREQSVKSAAVTLSSEGVCFAIHMVSAVILARLLTPADYGTVAMVTAITAFARIFADLGLSAATIQKLNMTEDQSSNLFWINAGMGVAITVLVAALSPVIAWFYQKPELNLVTLVLSLSFVVSALGAQQAALLNRALRFTALAVVRIAAMLAGLIVSIVFALLGTRYWALVSGTLAMGFCATLGYWIASGWVPGRPVRTTGTFSMLRFGSWITGFSVVNYFSRNMDNILIGRAWGSSELGLYSRAYSLLMLPISNLRGPMDKVAFPAMSKLQAEPARYRAYLRKYCSALAFLSMPAVAFLYLVSEPLIRLLLGTQWIGAAELFSILAVASFIQPVTGIRGLVLLSLGQGRRYFIMGICLAVTAVGAFLVGLPWGARGVAMAYAISYYLILHPLLAYAFRNTPVRPADFYLAIWRPAAASIVACFGCMFIPLRVAQMSDWLAILIYGIIFGVLLVIVFLLLPGGRAVLKENGDYLRILFRSPAQKAEPR